MPGTLSNPGSRLQYAQSSGGSAGYTNFLRDVLKMGLEGYMTTDIYAIVGQPRQVGCDEGYSCREESNGFTITVLYPLMRAAITSRLLVM